MTHGATPCTQDLVISRNVDTPCNGMADALPEDMKKMNHPHEMTKANRIEILKAARRASASGDHETARVLFALCDISYLPAVRIIATQEEN